MYKNRRLMRTLGFARSFSKKQNDIVPDTHYPPVSHEQLDLFNMQQPGDADEADLFGGYTGWWEDMQQDKPGSDSARPDRRTRQESCNHIWTLYTGFNEVYYYCELCDLKKDVAK